jgi:hypothetical protein
MPAPPATRRTRNQRSRVVIPTREKPLTIEGCHHINLRSTDGVLPLPPLPSQVATVVKHVLRIVDERYLTNVETAVVTQMTGLTERVKIPSSKSGWLDDSLLPLARGRAACTKELRARLGRWREGGGATAICTPLKDALTRAFTDDSMPLRVARFTTLCSTMVKLLEDDWDREGGPRVTRQLTERVDEACRPDLADPLTGLKAKITLITLVELISALERLGGAVAEDPTLLAEEASHAQRRAELRARINALTEDARRISFIVQPPTAVEGGAWGHTRAVPPMP